MKLSAIRKNRKGQGGQVLAFALVLMIIVIVAAFILFDTQTVIRGKVKGQTAVDSAALTGATWQQHALNLIGELNLAKASTVLLSDTLFGITNQDGKVYWATHVKDEDAYYVVAMVNGDVLRDEDGNIKMAIYLNWIFDDINRVIREKEKLRTAVGLLSQMQTRVSFVLPLIGYGAAQQAAKNNGVTYNAEANDTLKDLCEDVRDGDLYGNPDVAPQVINGYSWRLPYANMLESILKTQTQADDDNTDGRGVAVFSSVNWLGAPIFHSDSANRLTAYLGQKWFYEAILSNSWCELKEILLGDYDFSGAWWGEFECDFSDSFLEESEILPLHVEFFTGAAPYYNAHIDEVFPKRYKDKDPNNGEVALLGPYYDNQDPYKYEIRNDKKIYLNNIDLNLSYDEYINLLQEIKKGDRTYLTISPFYHAEDTDLNYNILPEFTWCVYDSSWTRYNDEAKNYWKTYLRSGFREGYDYYSGALSWFGMEQPTKTITGNMLNEKKDADLGKPFKGMDAADDVSAAQRNLRQGVHEIEADALAKPLGRIKTEDSGYKPPFAAGNLVLPVFTETALIPVALEPVSGFEQNDKGWIIFLTKFIPLLGENTSGRGGGGSSDENSESDSNDAVSILNKTMAEMRQANPDDSRYCNRYVEALKKISNPLWRARGKTWLEKPASYDRYGNATSFNKDHCDDWSGGGSGHRKGPGNLH